MDVSREGGWGSGRNVHGTFLVTKSIYESSLMFKTILLPFTQTNFSSTLLTSSIIDDKIITGGKSWLSSLVKEFLLFTLKAPSCSLIQKGCENQTHNSSYTVKCLW